VKAYLHWWSLERLHPQKCQRLQHAIVTIVLALVTLGDATKIVSFLFELCHPRWPRKVLLRVAVADGFTYKLRQCKWSIMKKMKFCEYRSRTEFRFICRGTKKFIINILLRLFYSQINMIMNETKWYEKEFETPKFVPWKSFI
jgi:hypothetical protein